ncbi:MAG: Uma2 family endonuclease [Acidobacteria bacterium]|nr:Uma2 family endonuclease [Acidobacteriota bacterium]
MGAAPVRLISEKEFLSHPAYEKCEYIDGHVVGRNVGNKLHSIAQLNCGALLLSYIRRHRVGYAGTELRCRVKIGGRFRFYQPDVCVVLDLSPPDSSFLDRAPDLAVEVRSPDDSIAGILDKMRHYFANGSRLGWVLLPEEKSVLVLTPNQPPRTASGRGTLDGGKVLPGLRIRVDKLFS